MIFRGSRAFSRLSQLTFPSIENHRIAPFPWSGSKRVLAFYSTSLVRNDSDCRHGSSVIASIARRAYATAKPVSRPKAHTGRTTTSPRKKAVPKIAAAKKPAVAKPKAAKPKAAKKSTKSKPKPKPKPKPKVKPKAKPKKLKAKPKAKPKAKRKVLTDVQKTKLVAAKEKLTVKKLKELALTPPHGPARSTAWLIVHDEAIKERDPASGIQLATKAASTKYKNLTPEQLEHYNHIANQNKAKYEATYRKWIESYTPAQIRLANKARLNLKRRTNKAWQQLHDERQVKGRKNPYIFFYTERIKSGDFHGINPKEAVRLVGTEWKALPADERKKYNDMAAQDRARYEQEQKAVYNRDVDHSKTPSSS